ncbi:D-isomer specific 2-hydroxyacid dehydrogenase, NAD binding domain [Ceratobasidium sp. AG-Ba]|nr:D-isomer specific 2-hydroxyacid dehydrogenase, NAD binding domain [Ceratobasidium sp. AG-Ba]
MPAKVVVSRHLGDQAMEMLAKCPEIKLLVWPHDRKADREWLLEAAKDAVGLVVTLSDKVDKELLNAAGPSLKVVSTMSVGYDHIDVGELTARGIKLGFTPDVLTDAVADIAIMLALMASRNVKQSMDIVHAGHWPATPWSPFLLTGPQLSSPGTTVGFVGFGRIARATLARLIPFGISRVLYTRSSPPNSLVPTQDKELMDMYSTLADAQHVTTTELARQSDFVFVLAPGGANSRHLINREFLRSMKPKAILINPGRGSVVDSGALAEALREGRIWGAGLDVIDGGIVPTDQRLVVYSRTAEPNIPADHPLVKEPRAIVLPHIGSATLETRLNMAILAADNMVYAIKGDKMPSEAKI